jgi:hypothetical protein
MSPELVSSRTPRQPLKRHELFERFIYRYWARWTGHTRNIQGYDLGGAQAGANHTSATITAANRVLSFFISTPPQVEI